jgi:hypothetical protein
LFYTLDAALDCARAPVILTRMPIRSKCCPPPRYQLNDQNHYCKHQQDVNKSTQGVRADQSHQPQDQKDHKNRPEHSPTSTVCFIAPTGTFDAESSWQVVRLRQLNMGHKLTESGDCFNAGFDGPLRSAYPV